MSKAEKFIQDYTSGCSNELVLPDLEWNNTHKEYSPWLTPDQARKAVEIAREEIINKTLDFLKDKLYESGYIGIMDLCDEYIKTMKDEQGRRTSIRSIS